MVRRAWSPVLCLAAFVVACGGDDAPADAGGIDASAECARDVDCDDGRFCNGVERCAPDATAADARGCAPSPPPCGTDACDEAANSCTSACAAGAPDADGDGVDSIACGGADCDDGDADRFPGNAEVCDAGHDEDCDPTTIGMRDADGDGRTASTCCNGALCGDDCDDAASSVFPGATEVCNDVDDDCDRATDEGLPVQTYARDCDGDGFGEIGGAVLIRCAAPTDPPDCEGGTWSTNATDCDDTRPSANPANGESCDDVDNDCDGTIDEGIGGTSLRRACFTDVDEDGRAPADAVETGVCTDVCPRFTTDVRPVDEARTDCDDTDAAVADLVDGRADGDRDGVGGADARGCPTADGFIPSREGPRDCDDADGDVFPGQTAFFPTPTGRGCPDSTYDLVCGDGTCGRLVYRCAPCLYWPTCGSTDVIPEVDLWNYDCNPLPTAPPASDGCGGCGGCRGGYAHTGTAQCGETVEHHTCTDACHLTFSFCVRSATESRPLPCR